MNLKKESNTSLIILFIFSYYIKNVYSFVLSIFYVPCIIFFKLPAAYLSFLFCYIIDPDLVNYLTK